MITGITFGVFDLLHAGHCVSLEECRRKCDYLIVGLQTDPTIDRPEKNRPIQSLLERQIQLQAVRWVDRVIVYTTEADLLHILDMVPWDVRFLGGEYRDREFTGRAKWIDRCHFTGRHHGYSSSELRQRVAAAEAVSGRRDTSSCPAGS